MKKTHSKHALKILSRGHKKKIILLNKLLFIVCLLCSPSLVAQKTTRVTGQVTDQNGINLIGVNVIIKNTTKGTITDINGHYELNVPSDGTLKFSFIGYVDQGQKVNSLTEINVVLIEEAEDLDEIVVIGYGSMRKRDLTGSIASISSEKISERPYSNVLQSLSGQMPGVNITQNSGAPGMAPSIRIRGASSINSGTSPLYVIDGIPIEDSTPTGNGEYGAKELQYNMNPLNTINPNDIASVEILKDAASAAIYGSRGANGVVLITTKQGQAGRTKLEASYEFGISKVANEVEMMNAPEFIEWTRHYRNNTWITECQKSGKDPNKEPRPINRQVPPMFDDPEWLERIGTGTNWQDVLFHTAFTHNAQISVSGGTEKTQFLLSSSYLNSEGVVENTYYNRLNLRTNIQHQFTKNLKIGANLSFAHTKSQMFGANGKSDAVGFALQSNPIFPEVNEVGTYSHRDPNSIWYAFQPYSFQLWHPYIFTRESENRKTGNNVLANVFAEYNIIPDLVFRSSIGGNIDDLFYRDYRNTGQKYGHEQYRPAEANERTQNLYNWVWENTLNYNKSFGNHAITGLFGYTVQKQRVDNSQITGTGFPNDLVKTMNAATEYKNISSTRNEWSMISYIIRTTYAYQGKYLATGTIRADGCSRFGPNNRWGYFPSISVAWRLTEEKFMKNTLDWLNNLKLRISYGVTGNNQIPNYGAIGLLDYDSYVFNGQLISGMYPSNFADKNLSWEKTGQINTGIDVSFFNNRLNLTLDYYYSKTKDLLLNVPIPAITGYTSTLTNIGELENQGIELQLSSQNLIGEFKWNTDFNISKNRNKIRKLGNNDAPIIMSNNSCNILIEVGEPLGNYYGYQYDGVIMSESELYEYPVFAGSEVGDPKIADVNKDGKVDPNDRTIIGNYQPDFTWGLTNTFIYKGFDLSIMLTGSHGGEIMNQMSRFALTGRANRAVYKRASNFWKSESDPGDGWHYKPRDGESSMQNQCSSYWVEDGSFVRIKNIRLGYTLPSVFTKKLGISSLKLYLNVENLHVFSDYTNYDPEASSFQTGVFSGFDYGAYPNPRIWTMGINFNF